MLSPISGFVAENKAVLLDTLASDIQRSSATIEFVRVPVFGYIIEWHDIPSMSSSNFFVIFLGSSSVFELLSGF